MTFWLHPLEIAMENVLEMNEAVTTLHISEILAVSLNTVHFNV